MKPTYEQLGELLRAVLATEPEEIDCEEFLARVGAFVDTLEPDQDIPPEFHQVVQHLEVCGECKEEFEALLEVARSQS